MFNLRSKKNKKPIDENGLAHGEWIAFHNNGKLWYRHNFIHGKDHGIVKAYSTKGKIITFGNFDMGRKIGYWYDYGKKQYYLCLI